MFLKALFNHWTYRFFLPGTALRGKYEAFKSLLEHDKESQELLAEIESIYYNQRKVDLEYLEHRYNLLSERVAKIVECLNRMCPTRYSDLKTYFRKLDAYARFLLESPCLRDDPPYTLLIDEIEPEQYSLVGGKAFNLARMLRDLQMPVPEGFVITTSAFNYFLKFNHLREPINSLLAELDVEDSLILKHAADEATSLIMGGRMPPELEDAIERSFQSLASMDDDLRIAMRSSALAEDSKSSFAGQYTTVLNVREKDLVEAYKKVIASKYSPRALSYRVRYGLSDEEVPMAVLALRMVDARSSGVVYTQNIGGDGKQVMTIHSVWGLGEMLVSGRVSPDIITVDKGPPVVVRSIQKARKTTKMVVDTAGTIKVEAVQPRHANRLSIARSSVLQLAQWAMIIEDYNSEPQDIEWCIDQTGKLYLLQTRSLNLKDADRPSVECRLDELGQRILLAGGECASRGVGVGRIFKIKVESDIDQIPQGVVLVARYASPHYVQVIDRLNAVVTDIGSSAGHFASVAREFQLPVLVNTGKATTELEDGREVSVIADQRVVLEGVISLAKQQVCSTRGPLVDTPYARKLRYMISFISPLTLTDPSSADFVPGKCRSLHDIIRFCHEKAVAEMFSIGDRRLTRKTGARKLVSTIPMVCYVLDVGGGLETGVTSKKEVSIEQIRSLPMRALWKGLMHPQIRWSDFTHFNWEEFDRIVMSGGIISAESAQFASYAVVSHDYLNLNLKFGYHFVILDALCEGRQENNYILFRFSGGGADFYHRTLRADFVKRILERLQFVVKATGDLVDAEFKIAPDALIQEKLDWLGRLLGATRLMDMYLKDASQVAGFVEEFMDGRYHFASVEE